MKCAACGAPLSAWHRFCADCGEPRPRWPEPFEDCLARFQSLTSRWAQGQLSDPEYEAGLRDLAFPYKDSYWTIGAQSGNWYRHDGQGWLKDDPLQVTASPEVTASPDVTASPASSPPNGIPATSQPATTEPAARGTTTELPTTAAMSVEPQPTPAESRTVEPSPVEPFALDDEEEPPRQEPAAQEPAAQEPAAQGPAAVDVSPRPAGVRPVNVTGPRPTVRLNMPEVMASSTETAPTEAPAPVVAPAVARPPRPASGPRPVPLQAQQPPQQEAGLGCVRPAMIGFVAALVLLCVLILLAAWLQPELLRPLVRLLGLGG